MKKKIGVSVIAIGVIHMIFGFAVFSPVWMEMIRDGLFNVIGEDPLRGAVIWFELYSLPIFAMGHTILTIEERGDPIPRHLFWYLSIILLTGVFFIPASGFWLLLIPLYGLWSARA